MARMIEPTYPGVLLREDFLADMGIRPATLAKAIGVDRAAISKILSGKRDITADMSLRLGLFFNQSDGFWLNLQTRYSLSTAKRRGWPGTGRPSIPSMLCRHSMCGGCHSVIWISGFSGRFLPGMTESRTGRLIGTARNPPEKVHVLEGRFGKKFYNLNENLDKERGQSGAPNRKPGDSGPDEAGGTPANASTGSSDPSDNRANTGDNVNLAVADEIGHDAAVP